MGLAPDATLSIGPVAEHLVHVARPLGAADFAGMAFLPIEKPHDLGRLQTIGEGVSRGGSRGGPGLRTREKTGRNVAAYEPRFALDLTLPGQAALIAAEESLDTYAFRLSLGDAPAGGSATTRYFIAAVGGLAEAYGGPEDEPMLVADLWVNSNIVRVAAAPAPEEG